MSEGAETLLIVNWVVGGGAVLLSLFCTLGITKIDRQHARFALAGLVLGLAGLLLGLCVLLWAIAFPRSPLPQARVVPRDGR